MRKKVFSPIYLLLIGTCFIVFTSSCKTQEVLTGSILAGGLVAATMFESKSAKACNDALDEIENDLGSNNFDIALDKIKDTKEICFKCDPASEERNRYKNIIVKTVEYYFTEAKTLCKDKNFDPALELIAKVEEKLTPDNFNWVPNYADVGELKKEIDLEQKNYIARNKYPKAVAKLNRLIKYFTENGVSVEAEKIKYEYQKNEDGSILISCQFQPSFSAGAFLYHCSSKKNLLKLRTSLEEGFSLVNLYSDVSIKGDLLLACYGDEPLILNKTLSRLVSMFNRY